MKGYHWGTKRPRTKKLPLFVYGILKPGYSWRSIVGHRIANGTLGYRDAVEGYCLTGHSIARAVRSKGGQVIGWLWHLEALEDDLYWQVMDRIDQIEVAYDRSIVKTRSGSEAYMYTVPRGGNSGWFWCYDEWPFENREPTGYIMGEWEDEH